MSLKLREYTELLKKENLLIKYIGDLDVKTVITSLTYNSKEAKAGTLFVCKGTAFKEDYLKEAVSFGACAYVSEKIYDVNVPCILVKGIRKAMPHLAKAFYDIPDNALKIIAVTGTKGKTTTCYYLKEIFDDHYKKCGRSDVAFISSIETYDGLDTESAGNTTPEIFEVYRHLRNAYDNGINTVIMEVSSQGLKYDRVSGIPFEVGTILNISPDHVSPVEHPDYDDYIESKFKLIGQCKNLIINMDDEFAKAELRNAFTAEGVYTFGALCPADYRIYEIYEEDGHVFFTLSGEGYEVPFELGMRGTFNIGNAVTAIIIGRLFGIPFESMKCSLKNISVPGRGETYFTNDNKISAIVDYAHNAISCEKIIKTAKSEWPDRKIISVFGCTGGKALNRREGMGKNISALSDKVYLTADDPALEDVIDICNEVASYMKGCEYEIVPDREEAIKKAFKEASDSPSAVMVLGKGCETSQKIGKKNIPYISDTVVVKECIDSYNKSKHD